MSWRKRECQNFELAAEAPKRLLHRAFTEEARQTMRVVQKDKTKMRTSSGMSADIALMLSVKGGKDPVSINYID